jgi:quercetin dioxygenase-like cupin family protein
MKRAISILICVAGAAFVTLLLADETKAPDALTANPQNIRLKLENEHVRVLEARLEPGQRENAHSHPAYVVYVLAGGTLRVHGADGKTSDLTLETGDVMYREPVVQHWAENIGATATHLILVELKGER